jgi:hypothetical protein
MPAQLDRSTATAPGSDEVPTKRAEFGTIRRDFPDPVDGSPHRLAPTSFRAINPDAASVTHTKPRSPHFCPH